MDTGREPACVTVCPEDAIIAGDMENPDTEITKTIADQEVQARKPEKGTEPKLFYVDGDEGSVTAGVTAREDHYMWSDAPHQMETRGAAREQFDLQRAAESLAESDVSIGEEPERGAEVRQNGDCACGGKGQCGSDGSDSPKASDGGERRGSSRTTSSKTRTERAYELLHEEARRVYDVGENHYQSWGWEVYCYTWTKSISAGVFLIPALLILGGFVEPDSTLVGGSALLSMVFLGVTGFLLIADLERPRRFHWVLLRPNWSSWLVKGAYIITAFGAFLGLLMVGWITGSEFVTHRAVLSLGVLLAMLTAVYTAFLFSQSKGRDLWQSPALPAHMFVQALIAGGAVVGLLGMANIWGFEALLEPARITLGGGLLAHAALVGSEIFTPHQTEDAEEAAARITRGRFRNVFWAGGILIGIAVPLVALAVSGAAAVAIGGALALGGLLAFEYCWITAPQTISLA